MTDEIKNKVRFFAIIISGVSSVCSLFNIRALAMIFAVVSLTMIALTFIIKEK